ncbi:MAG: serine/threonine-protein kinase [Prochlorotrichaceae cyanobacterium]
MSFSPPGAGRRQRVVRSNYRLLGLIGQGQFGKVYCAIHRKSGKLVALKSLDRYRLSTQQFLRELRFLLSLRHPNIVSCQALEHTARGRYLVMDYCPGGTFRDLLEEEQCIVQWSHGIQLLGEVLKGLAHAHAQKIIHCDIKPENILLDPTPKGWVARISDFGIAHVIQEEGSGDSGSPAYMAPERFYGQYHLSSDLYAVGIMLFELLVGERPFSGTPSELRIAHLNQPPHIPEFVPPELAQVLQKSLKKLPGQRFQSAQTMGDALAAAAKSLGFDEEGEAASKSLSSYFQKPDAIPPLESLPEPIATLKFPSQLTGLLISPLDPEGLEVYGASGQTLFHQSYIGESIRERQNLVLSESPTQIAGTAGGVLVSTHQGLYWWTGKTQGAEKLGQWKNRGDRHLYLNPEQRWFMVGIPGSEHQLYIGSLNSSRRPKMLRSLTPTGQYDRAFLLDTVGRGILMGDREGYTWIQGINRRSQILGELQVPVRLRSCQLTCKPYRIAGFEADSPHLIFLDLKPYRLRRFYLPIQPTAMTSFSWGYALSGEGIIVMLDTEGRLVGQFRDEGDPPRALRSLRDHQLVIWRETPAETIVKVWDVHTLNLDMIF